LPPVTYPALSLQIVLRIYVYGLMASPSIG
jgi:hypothetical protein